jgi:protein-disulfide isomerase
LQARYIDSGQVAMVFSHFPLEALHPFAKMASQAAECAAQHGKFWAIYEKFFAEPVKLDRNGTIKAASSVRLDEHDFENCLDGKPAPRIEEDVRQAIALGFSVTPTFVIGTLQPDQQVRASTVIAGARPVADFAAAIDPLLK